MRVVFMGTPVFAVPTLQALHEAGHEIVAVYTQPPRPAGRGQKEQISPVHQYAQAHGLPIFTPEKLRSPESQAQFKAHNADIAVVVAYGLLLPKPILEAYPRGCINVHPSLLPRWRGAAPLQRTIMAGDTQTAIVIMQMDEGLDTGDMLLVERYDIPEGTNAGMLHDHLSEEAGYLIIEAIDALAKGTLKPVPQPKEGATYAKKLTREDVAVDWSRPADEVYHHILGLTPYPGSTFQLGDETLKLLNASLEKGSGQPGTTLDDQLLVACGNGAIRITAVQRPNKKRMTAAEMLNGLPVPKGTKLG